jgi:hypothetical protein
MHLAMPKSVNIRENSWANENVEFIVHSISGNINGINVIGLNLQCPPVPVLTTIESRTPPKIVLNENIF